MATKKAPVKKVAAKAAAVKKPIKKAVKKVAPRKTAQKSAKLTSFKLYKYPEKFSKPRFSRQTIYWIILLSIILVTQLWIINIQVEIANLTNELIQNSADL